MSKKIILFLSCLIILVTKAEASFTDVSSDEWYYSAVKYVSDNNILNGVDDGRFDPMTNITRAMIAQIVYNMEETPEIKNESIYDDIEPEKWYKNAVIWAEENDIVKGIDDKKFAPNEFITKEQMITILYNYAKYKDYDISVGENTNILSYEDCYELSEYAYAPMGWACGSGIIVGYNGNLFPKKQLTRAEASTIIRNFLKYYPQSNVGWVELVGNPTTGYVWRAEGYDENIVKVFDYEYIVEENEDVVGKSGYFRFEIKGLKEGSTRIVFKYGRSWEENAIRTVICTIEIDKNKNINLSQQLEENIKSFIIKTSAPVNTGKNNNVKIIESLQQLDEYKNTVNMSDVVFNTMKSSFTNFDDSYFENNRFAIFSIYDTGISYELISVDRITSDTLALTINKENTTSYSDDIWYIFIELPNDKYIDINSVIISK